MTDDLEKRLDDLEEKLEPIIQTYENDKTILKGLVAVMRGFGYLAIGAASVSAVGAGYNYLKSFFKGLML